MAGDIRKEGYVSEWNEGTLFSLRMHEAKELINFGKTNPLAPSLDGKGWNYQSWIAGIEILFGEGNSKYSETEMKEIKSISHLIALRLKFRPPHKIVMLGNRKVKSTLDLKNWECLEKLIQLFEQKVKFYNDKRGMGTRNQTTEGLF